MFCPNCAADNNVGLRYCRSCGLKLDRIVEAVAEQLPSDVDADYLRRKEKFERTGRGYLVTAGVVALALAVFFVTQYASLGYFFGTVLFGSIVAWIFFFVLPAVSFYFYPRFFMEPKYRPRTEVPAQAEVPAVTSRLIEDRPFEPAPTSVTEDTTDLLNVPRSERR